MDSMQQLISEKPKLTAGRTMGTCAMTVALLTQSSRAKNPCAGTKYVWKAITGSNPQEKQVERMHPRVINFLPAD